MSEINDVDVTGLQDGYILIYSTANNKYETKSTSNISVAIAAVATTVSQIDGGSF